MDSPFDGYVSMRVSHWRSSIYKFFKPILPRPLQIALRRRFVFYTLRSCSSVWPIDPASGIARHGWQGWPSGMKFALVLTHDVENVRGLNRCLRLAGAEKALGFKSSFNFVPQKYALPPKIRGVLEEGGLEVGVHDLRHDGKLYSSKRIFSESAEIINLYLREWGAVGFRSASMYHNLEWLHALRVEYDSSTFDTDPFEPQPDGVSTIFPLWIQGPSAGTGYIELPYTLPQDLTLFVLLKQESIRIWKEKLDWIAAHGGMALLNTHPDYINWGDERRRVDEYAHAYYTDFLQYIQRRYYHQYWHALPMEVARFWRNTMVRAGNVK
jgi:hypothetical protein